MSPSRKLAIFSAVILAARTANAADDEAHATSSYMMSAISAGLPKFDPAQAKGNSDLKQPGVSPGRQAVPAGVTAMPAFTITEAKLPSSRQIVTYKGWTSPLVDKYMGPSDGIDRGVLNKYTLAQLWTKIPVLGRLPFVGTPAQMTISERALDDAGANDPLRTKPIE
jgi:hypothetical protein